MKKLNRLKTQKVFNFISIVLVWGFAIIIFFLNGCATSRNSAAESAFSKAQAQNINLIEKNYVIKPGDKITVTVWNYDQFNINQVVSNDGIINYPLLGELQVEGLSKPEFISLLKSKLANYMNADINLTVSISRPNDKEIIVLGSVVKPANYPIEKSSSILQVLAEAGGPSTDADLRHIQIYRPGMSPNRVSVNLDNYFMTTKGRNISNPPYQVNPGDIIYIPKSDNLIRDLSGFMQDAIMLFGVFRIFY